MEEFDVDGSETTDDYYGTNPAFMQCYDVAKALSLSCHETLVDCEHNMPIPLMQSPSPQQQQQQQHPQRSSHCKSMDVLVSKKTTKTKRPRDPFNASRMAATIKRVSASKYRSIVLNRERMLTMTPEEYDRHVQLNCLPPLPHPQAQDGNERELRQDVQKVISYQARCIKNRISARESRKRSKKHIDTLTGTISVYRKENLELLKRIEALEAENKHLSSRIDEITGFGAHQ